ncbi:hypothetical protein EYF80_019371 [Liparis tanakae]|uniref:Uncharacterized protein n=1 Tax=Liparis tanakae TaxID=230148 RepID=A0A4Z2HYF4_9TELE|nr:hypothetical protein EYF80_019371 [Liparis tanakae]
MSSWADTVCVRTRSRDVLLVPVNNPTMSQRPPSGYYIRALERAATYLQVLLVRVHGTERAVPVAQVRSGSDPCRLRTIRQILSKSGRALRDRSESIVSRIHSRFFFPYLGASTLYTVFLVSRGPSPTEKRKPRRTPPAFACALKVPKRSKTWMKFTVINHFHWDQRGHHCFSCSECVVYPREPTPEQQQHKKLLGGYERLPDGDPIGGGKPLVALDIVDSVPEVAEALGQVHLQQISQQILQVRAEVGGKANLQTSKGHGQKPEMTAIWEMSNWPA